MNNEYNKKVVLFLTDKNKNINNMHNNQHEQ